MFPCEHWEQIRHDIRATSYNQRSNEEDGTKAIRGCHQNVSKSTQQIDASWHTSYKRWKKIEKWKHTWKETSISVARPTFTWTCQIFWRQVLTHKMMQFNIHAPFVKGLVRKYTESYPGLKGIVTSKGKRDKVKDVLVRLLFSAESFTWCTSSWSEHVETQAYIGAATAKVMVAARMHK